MPSIIWLLLKQVHSPWWLENALSTSFIILVFYCILMLTLIYFVSYLHCLGYFLINFILAILLNNTVTLSKGTCNDPIVFFQFNMKYNEGEYEINELIEHLVEGQYHLITLQGVSQRSKRQIVEKLSPYYPHFILGESEHRQIYSDQLLFSHYGFHNIKYYKSGNNSFLINSQWQLPFSNISLYTLHPPSPRNEKLWQTRNKIIYQLKHAINRSSLKVKVVVGDLNLSKNSSRIKLLGHEMNTEFVNSWPNKHYVFKFLGLAIDHFWVSKPATICSRQRIEKFNWSDHFAVKTKVDFKY